MCCSRAVHRLPMGCAHCLWAVHGLPVGCPRAVCGLSLACPRAARGPSVGCPWASMDSPRPNHAQLTDCSWVVHGLPLACGISAGRSWASRTSRRGSVGCSRAVHGLFVGCPLAVRGQPVGYNSPHGTPMNINIHQNVK